MAELRWNPMIKDWVMIASHRQNRPLSPKDWCPFCPGEGKNVPADYDVLKYDNDFPALSPNPPVPDEGIDGDGSVYKKLPAYGKCEVILYSPDHKASLCSLPLGHIEKLVELWSSRFKELSSDELVKYVFIFENRGAVVGTTMPHPHGQIYAYSVIPKKIELEVEAAREHKSETGHCLFCDMNNAEEDFGGRIIFENESFLAYIPYFCEYPYGVYISAKKHIGTILDMDGGMRRDLASALKNVTGAYDNLFGYEFPYMMCMHNAPVNMDGADDSFHFHIEFFPPMRSADRQKFNASSETGVWAHCNPTAPEEKALELKAALEKFITCGV
ncbi:MAG: galactose-1-phosphate uridylyltransferase [Eubacteriales bacterium]